MNHEEPLEQIEQIETLEPIFELLEMLISRYGPFGIAAAMFAESAGVPFVSTIVLLTAGTMILRGSVSFWTLLLASTIGITLGSIFSYIVGRLGSMAGTAVKSGLFHHHQHNDADEETRSGSKFMNMLVKYGKFSIFLAQLWGVTRTFGSFPAGAMHMNIFFFVGYTFMGGLLFSFIYIGSSIVLTGTMGAALSILKTVLDISPWLFILVLLILLAVIYLIVFRIKKGFYPRINRVWDWLKGVSDADK